MCITRPWARSCMTTQPVVWHTTHWLRQSQSHISFFNFTHIALTQNDTLFINFNVYVYCVCITTSLLSTAAGIALTLIVDFCAIIALSMSKYTRGDVLGNLEGIVNRLNGEWCVSNRIFFTSIEKTMNVFCEYFVRNSVRKYFFPFSTF